MRHLDLFLITLIILMTLKGGTSGACAACKFQRRRCATDCPLAPYFPAEQPKLFQNVHRLFGVRSIVKILEKLDENQKPEAMKSIIFQSYIRDRSPVHGCLGLTQQLQYMIWLAEEELKVVNSQLQIYRSQRQNGQNQDHNQMIHQDQLGVGNKQQEGVTSQLDLGMGLNLNKNQSSVVATPFFSPLPVSEAQYPQMSYTYSGNEVNNNGYSTSAYNRDSGKEILTNNSDVCNWGGQNRFLYNNNDGGVFSNLHESCHEMKSSVTGIQSQLVNLQMVSNPQQEEEDDDAHEYDEIHQFLHILDDKQSFAAEDSKEAYASTSGESSKQQIDEVEETELRSAATCFSLTNVN